MYDLRQNAAQERYDEMLKKAEEERFARRYEKRNRLQKFNLLKLLRAIVSTH